MKTQVSDRLAGLGSLQVFVVLAVCGAVFLAWGSWRLQDAAYLYRQSAVAQVEGLAILERLGPPAQSSDQQALDATAQVDVGFTTRLESALDSAGVSTGSLQSVTPRILQDGRVSHRLVLDPISLVASVRVLESLCGVSGVDVDSLGASTVSRAEIRVDSYALKAPNRPSVDAQGHETWRVEVELLSTETLPR